MQAAAPPPSPEETRSGAPRPPEETAATSPHLDLDERYAPPRVEPGEGDRSAPAPATPWVVSTYFGQGLPYSIVHQTAAEFFTAMGASNTAVGLTSLYGGAWNLKFLWSPLVDLTGTPRRWLIATDALVALAVGALAIPAARADLGGVALALVAVSFLAATHDVAIDGFYMRALPKDRQASLSGLRVAAYRVAMLVGKGALVALAGLASWRACFLAAGGILGALALLHAWLLPAPRSEVEDARGPKPAAPEPRAVSIARFLGAFRSFLAQPRAAAIIAFILLFKAGDALMFAMSTPLLKQLGLDTTTRAFVSGTAGTIGGIVGSMAGGVLIARRGLARALVPIAILQSLAILLYAAIAAARPPLALIAAAVVTEQLVAGVGSAAFVVFLMRRCAGEYKASHFAIGTALMSLITTLAGPASGWLADQLGFTALFLIAWIASLPGVALARVVPKD
uniref:Membrane protein n=1 Tax=Phaselicystis flava TaxID=525924 RepID=A0A3S7V082_9BACT|nr:membrane protein [Phaselicystis flava]